MTGTVRVFSFCRSSLKAPRCRHGRRAHQSSSTTSGLICRRSAKERPPAEWGFASYPAACKCRQIRHRDRLFVFHNRNQCHVCFLLHGFCIHYTSKVSRVGSRKKSLFSNDRGEWAGKEEQSLKAPVPPSTAEGTGAGPPPALCRSPFGAAAKGFFLLDGLPDLGLVQLLVLRVLARCADRRSTRRCWWRDRRCAQMATKQHIHRLGLPPRRSRAMMLVRLSTTRSKGRVHDVSSRRRSRRAPFQCPCR